MDRRWRKVASLSCADECVCKISPDSGQGHIQLVAGSFQWNGMLGYSLQRRTNVHCPQLNPSASHFFGLSEQSLKGRFFDARIPLCTKDLSHEVQEYLDLRRQRCWTEV